MHKATKAVLNLDATPHEHEAAIMSLFHGADRDAATAVSDARAAGFSFSTIIALMLQYGPQFVSVIQALIAALKTTPPTPVTDKHLTPTE